MLGKSEQTAPVAKVGRAVRIRARQAPRSHPKLAETKGPLTSLLESDRLARPIADVGR